MIGCNGTIYRNRAGSGSNHVNLQTQSLQRRNILGKRVPVAVYVLEYCAMNI